MFKDYSKIIQGMTNTLWLMEEKSLATLCEIVNRRISGDPFDDEEIRLRIEAADNGDREHSRVEVGGGVGIIPIYGHIFPKSNLMTEVSGATSLEVFRNDLQTLVNDDKVKSIVLDIDSPGGAANMMEETGIAIREAREVKPITAVANTDAFSGAYWLASQATEFYSTPSGGVGSLGVYAVHEDVSKQDEAAGRKVTFISAGKFKTTGNPHEPLSGEGRAYLQGLIDEQYERFIDEVATGRGVDRERVKTDFADGRMFSASQAAKLGMIDGIKSLDSAVDSLLAQNHTPVIKSSLQGAMQRHHASVMKLEAADMEHSEPGTGSPPERRDDNDIQDNDPAYGSRRDTPPIAKEEEVMNEFLVNLAKAVGVKVEDSDTDETLQRKITEQHTAMVAEIQPLREAEAEAKKTRAFREDYPEEYARLQELNESDRDSKAKAFASRYERFVTTQGEGEESREVPSAFGFSARTLSAIEDAHKELKVNGQEQLRVVLDSIASTGVVDYSSRGSSRLTETDDPVVDVKQPRAAFAQEVRRVMEEDNLERSAAIQHVAKTHPDLYDAYVGSPTAENGQ